MINCKSALTFNNKSEGFIPNNLHESGNTYTAITSSNTVQPIAAPSNPKGIDNMYVKPTETKAMMVLAIAKWYG